MVGEIQSTTNINDVKLEQRNMLSIKIVTQSLKQITMMDSIKI